jgi:mannose/cellobiose epimerase-like protein (N-acyl-D-glucosamine 2-epimerase family)
VRSAPSQVPNIDSKAIRTWLFDHALPFWAEHGLDKLHGGPVEEVALNGGVSDPGFKRVRVFARQMYVFSHAELMGWTQGKSLADAMYESMQQFAWQGPQKGWAKLVSNCNLILDPTTDLYDNAFALFALGWYYRISPRHDVRALMLATANLIDTTLRHPTIGFWHQMPSKGPRLQNPHMHLLEACLACFDATQEPIFERLGREVIAIFKSRFFDMDHGTLCEFFDDDLLPLAGDRGLIVEPGHQFEWAWILGNASKAFSLDLGAYINALIAFGEAYGVDPVHKMTVNCLYRDGRACDSGSRIWPNTERLKAAVAQFELFGVDTKPQITTTLALLFSKYLTNCPRGGWIDSLNAQGEANARAMPASTFYHLFLALAEVVRLSDQLNSL